MLLVRVKSKEKATKLETHGVKKKPVSIIFEIFDENTKHLKEE